jgi:oxidase EvaA
MVRVGMDVCKVEPVRHGHLLASVRQSDEGSRFFHDVARYSLIDVGSAFEDDNLLWLTLSEMQHLLPSGRFTNEARSVISLILRFI